MFVVTNLSSNEDFSKFQNETNKFYISSSDIFLEESQIFVIRDSELFTVDSIQVDNYGFFIESPKALEPHYRKNCGFMANGDICTNCNKNPRYK